eukprot:6174229-Pleurochrysis_carterae.AAC.2
MLKGLPESSMLVKASLQKSRAACERGARHRTEGHVRDAKERHFAWDFRSELWRKPCTPSRLRRLPKTCGQRRSERRESRKAVVRRKSESVNEQEREPGRVRREARLSGRAEADRVGSGWTEREGGRPPKRP